MYNDMYGADARTFRDEEGYGFQDPDGRSVLRRSGRGNPRNLPCPTCGRKNMLTPRDKRLRYQCDICADGEEGYFSGEF
jgi:hypothetical protein